jgi:iron complex outermembrane receptor protein
MGEKARLTAGIRYNHDAYHGVSSTYYSASSPTDGLKTNEVTGKLAYDYQFTPGSMGYASFTRGYKPAA